MKKLVHKTVLLSAALLVIMMTLPGAALANSGDEGSTVTVGGFQVSLVFAEPAKIGENPVHILILDAMGMPVNGAQVVISIMPVLDTPAHEETMESDVPAMSGMDGMEPMPTAVPSAAMSGMGGKHSAPTALSIAVEKISQAVHSIEAAKVILEPGDAAGEYASTIVFTDAGHWMLTAQMTINNQVLHADFPMEVAGGPAGLAIITGFAGINIVLIGVAAITKRKPVSA